MSEFLLWEIPTKITFIRLATEAVAKILRIVAQNVSDSNHLDPHMESLCRRVRKLSVSASNVVQLESTNDLVNDDFVESKSVAVDADDEAQVRCEQF